MTYGPDHFSDHAAVRDALEGWDFDPEALKPPITNQRFGLFAHE